MDAAAFGSSDWSLNLTQTPYSATQKIENCGCFWAPLNNSHQIRPLGVAQMSAVPGSVIRVPAILGQARAAIEGLILS